MRHGRRKPYTDQGLKRLSCVRCGSPATQQWSACADDSLWRPICTECDVMLNRLVLLFMCDEEAEEKIDRYQESLRVEVYSI
jgi:NAD-dependent SIR2 family protein deacetylase